MDKTRKYKGGGCMSEEKVFIKSEGDVILEGLLWKNSDEKAVLIAHPHPLYGGSMYNNVVEALRNAYYRMGWTTLRFNFRGVGKSSGSYSNGIGEREDLKAAFRYLRDIVKEKVAVSGYSFGSWVICSCIEELSLSDHFLFVSPPVSMIDFSFLKYNPKIKLIITGSYDDIAPPDMLKEMIKEWNPSAKLCIIEGADHFYWGMTKRIEKEVERFLKEDV